MTVDASSFPLVMISAMYENGGNTTHRILDGHPELYVYPFESQPGTSLVHDQWSGMYPAKYRWPVFALDGDVAGDYRAIIDEEAKVRTRTPFVSKFREHAFGLDDDARRDRVVELMQDVPRSAANIMTAFFTATFDCWADLNRSGREHVWVGYSPIFGIDAERFLADLPRGHVLHVVRNPWSAFADTIKRAVPLSLPHYAQAWAAVQAVVLAASEAHPGRVSIVRFEDICADPRAALGEFSRRVGIDPGSLNPVPTWNSRELAEVYPWGTIRRATPEQNRRTAAELDADQVLAVRRHTSQVLARFGYESYLEDTAGLLG